MIEFAPPHTAERCFAVLQLPAQRNKLVFTQWSLALSLCALCSINIVICISKSVLSFCSAAANERERTRCALSLSSRNGHTMRVIVLALFVFQNALVYERTIVPFTTTGLIQITFVLETVPAPAAKDESRAYTRNEVVFFRVLLTNRHCC